MQRSLGIFIGAALTAALLAGCGKTTPITSATPTPLPTTTPHVSSEYKIPTANALPEGITKGSDGSVWFVENAGNKLGRLSTSAVITEFPMPSANAGPTSITTGPDTELWMTEPNVGKIARFDISLMSYTEVTLVNVPSATCTASTNPALQPTPIGIATGLDGDLWMTDPANNGVWSYNPTTFCAQFYGPLPTANAGPGAIVYGPDSNLWFVETTANKIGKLNINGCTATCSITETPVATANAGLSSIVAGNDNALWFTETNGAKIGRITTNNVVTGEISLAPLKAPVGLALGEDGNFYIADETGDQIGQYAPSTQLVKAFAVPTAAAKPYGIAIGPDGEMYFTEYSGNNIGQLLYF